MAYKIIYYNIKLANTLQTFLVALLLHELKALTLLLVSERSISPVNPSSSILLVVIAT